MELKTVFKKAESNTRLPEGMYIQPREPDVEALRKTPKLWAMNDLNVTVFNNIFSLFIPRGELFFIRSVRNYKDKITDPELSEMVTAFMQQEVLHSKAHDAFNESFKQHGFDVDTELARINKVFNRVERWMPKKIQLGMTVFFEHLTATMAEGAFENDHMEVPDPAVAEVRSFLQWHAIEELEHKSVAWDVFHEMGGGYYTRILSAYIAPLIFFPVMRKSIRRMYEVYKEPNIKKTQEQKEAVQAREQRNKNRNNAVKDYFKRDFHPMNTDHTEMLNRWYEKMGEKPSTHAQEEPAEKAVA